MDVVSMSIVYTLADSMSILFYNNMATFPRVPYGGETPVTQPTKLEQPQGPVVGQV